MTLSPGLLAALRAHAEPAPGSGALGTALARWQHLVSPGWLAAWLAELPVAAAPARAWRLIEVGWNDAADFANGHVPGAARLDIGALERAPLWSKVPDDELLQVLLANGIRHDTTVILYSRHPLVAARAAHLLLYAGVSDVRLLDGGFRAWQAAGLPLQPGAPLHPMPCDRFGIPFPGRPDYLVDVPQARQLVRGQQAQLVSIRTWPEFIGATSGYSYIAARGEIPGAIWGRAGRDGDVHSVSEFQRADGTMKPHEEIAATWRDAAIDPGQRTVFYCGTSWRAALAFCYAWLMGWERIGVFDGGWNAWSSEPA